ncbi:hypothetical protein HW135_001191 [Listeria monocytogenes]|nr:hypothetical protein [Listeria monocytogenes]
MANDKRMSPEELSAYHDKMLNQAYNKISSGLKNLENPILYKLFLEHVGALKGLGLNNSILVHEQMDNAVHLETYKDWQEKHGVQVNTGSKAIRKLKNDSFDMEVDKDVLDSSGKLVRDDEGNPVRKKTWITIPRFKTEAVFDIGQTNGVKEKVIDHSAPKTQQELISCLESMLNISIPRVLEDVNIDQTIDTISIIQAIVDNNMQNKTDVFVKDEHGITNRISKSDEMVMFEKESIVYAVCKNYNIEMNPEKLLEAAKNLDKSDTNLFRGLLDSVHSNAVSTMRSIDLKFQEIFQDKSINAPEQDKSRPKLSLVNKLAKNKEILMQKGQNKEKQTKAKEMGLGD